MSLLVIPNTSNYNANQYYTPPKTKIIIVMKAKIDFSLKNECDQK